jgi:hypothetical protein
MCVPEVVYGMQSISSVVGSTPHLHSSKNEFLCKSYEAFKIGLPHEVLLVLVITR